MQTREELLREVWGHQHPANNRTVDTDIRPLREKLAGASHMIVTVRGTGYGFGTHDSTGLGERPGTILSGTGTGVA